MPEEQCARLTDLLTITSDTVTHCMVMNGIGGDMLAQEEVPLSLFLHRLRRNSQGQEALSYGLAPWGMNIRSVYQQHGIAVMLIEPMLRHIQRIWRNPVCLRTRYDGVEAMVHCDRQGVVSADLKT